MEKKEPIKRHEALQPLSREHHQGLLLAFKIGKGLSKNIEGERITKYLQWFFEYYLNSHFEAEEKYAFPILGKEHEMVKEAITQHREIKTLIFSENTSVAHLKEIQNLMKKHIRLEERQLFNIIQETASEAQLVELASQLHEEDFCLNYKDEFW